MFDELYCDWPLPDASDLKGVAFTTYSFDRNLTVYRITEEGRLLRHAHSVLEQTVGEGEDMNYHGDLEFEQRVNGKEYHYRARFTEGALTWIRRVE